MKNKWIKIITVVLALCMVVLSSLGCVHQHNYNKQVATDAFILSEATCETKAKYYYSCECGAKGEETFESGQALGHSFTNYVSDNNATCEEHGTKTAVCDRDNCSATRSRTDSNTKKGHDYRDCVSNQDGTHTKICANDNSHTIIENHSYKLEYNFNSTHHYQETICGCDEKGNYEPHSIDSYGWCTTCDYSATPTDGVTYSISQDNTYAQVVSYLGSSKKVNIAPTYNDLPVKVILENAFKDTNITYVVIPDTVETIGESAFYGCEYLERIVIPDSVTDLGQSSFNNCYALTSVVLSKNLTQIKASTFQNCNLVASFDIPNGVASVGDYAFNGCESITTFVFPNSVTQVGSSVFTSCRGLVSVYIPSSVVSMGITVFSACSTELIIRCGATEQPSGWAPSWQGSGANYTVYWGQ